MLVLSRRRDETIMIGDDIEITIVDIKGDTVRVGISAPKSVSVHRKEIYEAIQAENIAAAQHQLVPDAAAVGGLTALLAKPLAINPDALAAARRLSPGAAGTSGRHPRPGTARTPVEPRRPAAPAPEVPADAAPAPEEPSDPQQPQPGSAPGAAPVTAKSLAAMFKRK